MAIKIPKRKILREYQRKGVKFALPIRHPALWWKMRLGKTLTCIRTCLLYSDCRLFLVVGPFSVFPAWDEELRGEGQMVIQLADTRQKRLAQLSNLPTTGNVWCILNKEGHFVIPEVAGIPWDVVIIDESVFIADPSTKTTRFFCTHFRTAKHRWCLCGTPAPESPLQYFTQLQFLDFNLMKERNFYEFRHKYFTPSGFGVWNISEEGTKYLSFILNKCSMFLNRNDVKLGGIIVREQRLVKLPSEICKAYNQLEKEYYFELNNQEHDTIFAGQRYTWLRKFCSGFNKETDLKSFHKCDELYKLLTGELFGESIVVWCEYIEEVLGVYNYLIQKGFKSSYIFGDISNVKREERRQQFQQGKIQVLVILTSTMCFSAKLTKAAALIYFSSPVSGKIREQSENRHIDVSISDNALIIDLVCMDTCEEDILQSLIDKETQSAMIERFTKGIKRRIKYV